MRSHSLRRHDVCMTTKWYDRANALMKEKDLSRVKLARVLGQSPQSVSMKLQGARPTSVEQIAVIAGFLNVSAAELLADDDEYVHNLDEGELLKLFRMLNSDQKVSILNMMRSFVGNTGNNG